MTTHLSDEQINSLHTHKLRGSALVETLYHIQNCENCRNRIPKKSAQEVLHAVFSEESAQIHAKQKPSLISAFGQSLVPLTACILLLMLAGVAFFVFRNSQSQDNFVQANNALSSATPTISEIITPHVPVSENKETIPNRSFENSSKKEIVKTKSVQNQISKKQSPQKLVNKVAVSKAQISPQLNEVSQSQKVNFVWEKVKDAYSYEIMIFDKNYNEIAKQNVRTNFFRLENPLEKGNSYFWRLIVYDADGKVLATQKTENIGAFEITKTKKKQQLKRLEAENQDDLAVLNFMIEKGMLQEAKKKLTKLSAKNPNNAQVKRLNKKVDELIAK